MTTGNALLDEWNIEAALREQSQTTCRNYYNLFGITLTQNLVSNEYGSPSLFDIPYAQVQAFITDVNARVTANSPTAVVVTPS